MSKPGGIIKLSVYNFITHDHIDMYPCNNLNLILGPNGTGKSTLVAAIILGFGGHAKHVGRGTKLSDYIKNGCDVAKIEINVRDFTGSDPPTTECISREFTRSEHSTWKINGAQVSQKEVQNFTKKYNIQVENLCQVLPQEKVQMFAQLNKQELLQQTLIAVDKTELIDAQKELIELQEQQTHLQQAAKKQEQQLKTIQGENFRLQGRVKNYEQKKKLQEQLTEIERKMAWLAYDHTQAKIAELITKKEELDTAYHVQLNKLTASQNNRKEVKKTHDDLEKVNNQIEKLYKEKKAKFRDILDNREDNIGGLLQKIENEKKVKLHAIDLDENDIKTTELKIETLRKEKENIINTYGDNTKLQINMQAAQKQLELLNKQQDNGTEKKVQFDGVKRVTEIDMKLLEEQKQKLLNVKGRRLEKLRKLNNDVYNAIMWIRENKPNLKGKVFEPMILEIDLIKPEYAIYLENTIPKRDLIAFICTNVEDANTLLHTFHEELNYRVNIVTYSNESEPKPCPPLDNIVEYGFYKYMSELFTAPPIYKNYLNQSFHLNRLPIGTKKVDDLYVDIPLEIPVFFSVEYRYDIKVSTYSGERISICTFLESNELLSRATADLERLKEIETEKREFKAKYDKNNEELEAINQQLKMLDEKIHQQRSQIRQMETSRKNIKSIDERIAELLSYIQRLRSNMANPQLIEEEAEKQKLEIIKAGLKTQKVLNELYIEYTKLLVENEKNDLQLYQYEVRISNLDYEINTQQELANEAKKVLNLFVSRIKEQETLAKKALTDAKHLSDGLTREDDGFMLMKEAYDALSDDFDELDATKEEIQVRMGLLSTANDGELEEYDQQLAKIEELENLFATSCETIQSNKIRLETLREQFVEDLNAVIRRIDIKYGDFFAKFNCVGHVSLFIGKHLNKFEEFGISIMVTFREGVPLQQLNSYTQSGGERAVATAIYMLSLQDLTPAPFRCVDEINQGMDADNERRVFNLLAELANEESAPQYFFVTPKLVKKLKYFESTRVHVVFNGPFVCTQTEYNKHRGLE